MLNPNQKRFLMITLGVVEDELRRLKRLLRDVGEERLFLHIQDDIGLEEKKILNEKIDSLLRYLVHLKKLFDLERSEVILRYMVKATSVYLSIQLEEAMSHRLKGRGEVTLDLKKTLDPKLNEMRSILRQMESIVRFH